MENRVPNNEQTAATPMLRQYWQIKSEIDDKDTILFFRLGDFYEMFFDDAVTASQILDITLTSRNKNDPNPVPLCGIPYHAADGYITKLLAGGKKIAICEQVEDPKTAKGVVKREIVKIITPGVVMESESLVASQNNYLAAISPLSGGRFALAVCDASTGDFRGAILQDRDAIAREISRIEPREILVPRSMSDDSSFEAFKPIIERSMITVCDDPKFDPLNHGNCDLSALDSGLFASVGAIFSYLQTTHKVSMEHIKKVTPYEISAFMVIDEATKRNLELVKTISDGSSVGSLIWLLDGTKTAMGGRILRRWMFYPLVSVAKINERLDAVETLKNDFELFENLTKQLVNIADIERITSRSVTGSANPRELVQLKDSLNVLPKLKLTLDGRGGLIADICQRIDACPDLAAKIGSSIVDEPPLSVRDGGIIKNGVSRELDELRAISSDGKGFIARLESKERERTGISSLKIRFNRVFGYYIEVSNAHSEKIPTDYIRKQTLANAERYITPELKEYEEKVLGAEERIKQLENQLYTELRELVAGFAGRLSETAEALGLLDALSSLAEVANRNRYVKPVVTKNGAISINGGRHPIIEQLNPAERFVPNDVTLDINDCKMMMITGPNMAGKSTLMRQVALCVLMAQMGSFVPAAEAHIGVVDRIFTRVGASDNLIKGQSTFMVEMTEASVILKEATKNSLILIDEIGRGTSTYDGVSIAWAVAEFLHDKVGAKTLFATHYHELTDMALEKRGIRNFNVAVKEWNDKVIFLRKLVEGGVNRSYGIQVARLAGLPAEVVARAKEILSKLEKGEMFLRGAENIDQMPLFSQSREPSEDEKLGLELLDTIKRLDTNQMTPIEALSLLDNLKRGVSK